MGELILITFARHSIAESTNINESFKTTSEHLYNAKHGNIIKQNVKVVFENFSSLKGFTSSSSPSTPLSFSTSAQVAAAAAAFEGSLAGLSPTFTSYPESNSSGVVAPAQSNINRPKSFTKMLSASLYSSTAPTLNEINMPINPTKPSATIIANNKRPTVVIYPTVTPESIVIPIVSCILGFPLLALLVICCLRRRAKIARERDRRRNYDMQDHAVSLVRFSPIHRLNHRSSRAVTLRPERSLSRGFPSLELDTVVEEPSDPEQTQTDIISPDSPHDPKSYCEILSS